MNIVPTMLQFQNTYSNHDRDTPDFTVLRNPRTIIDLQAELDSQFSTIRYVSLSALLRAFSTCVPDRFRDAILTSAGYISRRKLALSRSLIRGFPI